MKDGGPAFPGEPEGWNADGSVRAYGGMSLRDYFAAAALMSDLFPENSYEEENVAAWAFRLADAMLAEREQK